MKLVLEKQKSEVFVDVVSEDGRTIVFLSEELQSKDFLYVMQFLYTGKFNETSEEDLRSVSQIATKLQISEIVTLCSLKLENNSTTSTELKFQCNFDFRNGRNFHKANGSIIRVSPNICSWQRRAERW